MQKSLKDDIQENNVSCILPWTKSMLNDSNNIRNNLTNLCKDNDDLWYGEAFANAASQYQRQGCLGLKDEIKILSYLITSYYKLYIECNLLKPLLI